MVGEPSSENKSPTRVGPSPASVIVLLVVAVALGSAFFSDMFVDFDDPVISVGSSIDEAVAALGEPQRRFDTAGPLNKWSVGGYSFRPLAGSCDAVTPSVGGEPILALPGEALQYAPGFLAPILHIYLFDETGALYCVLLGIT